MIKVEQRLTCIEICAGAGGAALGLEQAGFQHLALVEWDRAACATLRHNRPQWHVIEADVRAFDATPYKGVDLFSGGVPCPPFSVAGKQLGADDERNLFDDAIRLIGECRPKVVLLENVRGLLDAVFQPYRLHISQQLEALGYHGGWTLLNASDFGVPQLRPRAIFVALQAEFASNFSWPTALDTSPPTVGEILHKVMRQRGWRGADTWRQAANTIAPTLVGGSKKHGGPDLGPTRAKKAWAALGVDGHGLADLPPSADFEGMPRLTVPMTALLQGFPPTWHFTGKKTPAYRQVGNAFPSPVARAVGQAIAATLAPQYQFEAQVEG